MPLIINNPQGLQQLNNQEQSTSNKIAMVVPVDADTSNSHILIVDGKQKKVSKKSSYLLDMLVIDDE